MKKLINLVADQIDLGGHWLSNLILATFFTGLFIYAVPNVYVELVAHCYDKWDTLSWSEQILMCALCLVLPLVGVLLPLAEFQLAIRKWKNRGSK
jgi:hypothetical protein